MGLGRLPKFLVNMNISVPHNKEILLSGIFSREMNDHEHQNTRWSWDAQSRKKKSQKLKPSKCPRKK